MSESLYEIVDADQRLSQGDVILSCPVLTWMPHQSNESTPPLENRAAVLSEDVIVLTQACDLEQNKVNEVVLCRHVPINAFRKNDWERWMVERSQAPSEKAWRRFCEDISAGYVWNLSFLDRLEHADLSTEVRIVNFHKVSTAPRDFVEWIIRDRKTKRLRLRSPYREHLSQAFARFFMRVGLPQPVTPVW